MYFGSITLMVVVALLAVAGIQGVLKFRALTKNIRHRATELPLTADLNQRVSDLRVSYAQLTSFQEKQQGYLTGIRKDRLFLIGDAVRHMARCNMIDGFFAVRVLVVKKDIRTKCCKKLCFFHPTQE